MFFKKTDTICFLLAIIIALNICLMLTIQTTDKKIKNESLIFDVNKDKNNYKNDLDEQLYFANLKIEKLTKELKQVQKSINFDQRFSSNNLNWRDSAQVLDFFECDNQQFNEVKINAIVLNTFRKLNYSSYIYQKSENYNVIVINTTSIAKTDSWERNCQQAHTQILETFFQQSKVDYLLILEDDLVQNENITVVQYKNILQCAIQSKVHFLFLMNLDSTMQKYWYGTQAYLISRLSYFDFFRNSCFAVNSPLPVDGCLSNKFNLLVTKQNFVNHIFRSLNSTRNSFTLKNKTIADLTRVKGANFDFPVFGNYVGKLIL